jgi:hypothetical protein
LSESPNLPLPSHPASLPLPPGAHGLCSWFVDSSYYRGCCRAEEEEGRPGPARECQQEPGQEGEQGSRLRLPETQGTATAGDSRATHICRANLGTASSLQVHVEEPSAALCDESFLELEHWGCVHTLHPSMRVRAHTHTHTHTHTQTEATRRHFQPLAQQYTLGF